MADREYGTTENYSYLAQFGLHAVMPDRMGPKRGPVGGWSIVDFNTMRRKTRTNAWPAEGSPRVHAAE